ncbi:MAG: hypothetical protein AB7F75_02455 [Planctomycetota bacterium]
MNTPKKLDSMFPAGSPKYQLIQDNKKRFEMLAPIEKYVVESDKPDPNAAGSIPLPWHILKENQKWEDWMLPMAAQKWSDEASAAVQSYFNSPDEAKLEIFKKMGETMLRAIEQEEPPTSVRNPDILRLQMMAPFPGVHRQAILIDMLTAADDAVRFKALEMIKEEKDAPVWPLLQMYLSRPDKEEVEKAPADPSIRNWWQAAQRARENAMKGEDMSSVKKADPRNPQVRAYLESRLGAETLSKIESDLKILRQVHGANLVIRIKEDGFHPWSKALRLDSLADLNSDEIRQKGITAFEKAKKTLDDTVAAAKGDDEVLALFRDVANLEAGNSPDSKDLSKRVAKVDWGVRMLVAQLLVKTHSRNMESVTDLLLDLQRDKVRSVRVAANETLSTLYLIGPRCTLLPQAAVDSIVIQTWQAWRELRLKIMPADEKPVEVQLKEANRNTYTSFGPASHKVLEGTFGKIKITVVDHNANGRYAELGVDNFHAGDTDKPGQFLSRLVEIDGAWYHLEIDEIYKKLHHKPSKGPLGKVTIETKYAGDYVMPFVILAMGSDATITLFKDADGFKAHSVPAGNYSIYSSVIWIDKSLMTRGNQVHIGPGKGDTFEVGEGKSTTITFGGDLVMKFDADYYVKAADAGKSTPTLRIRNPVAYGSAGENYHDYSSLMAADASTKIIEVKAYKSEADKKASKTWKWQMHSDATSITDVDIYKYVYAPIVEKFDGVEGAWITLDFKPPFAIGCKLNATKIPLEKVEETRWNDLEGLDASGKPRDQN